MSLRRFFVFLLLGVGGVILFTVWLFPLTTDFRPQNPFWNGVEEFRQKFSATSLNSLSDLPKGEADSVLLVIPYLRISETDIISLRSYIESGSTVILADDFGYGNEVLVSLGVAARFTGAPLVDPLFNHRTSYFPLAIDLEPSPLTLNVSALALNYATTLEGEDLIDVARSSAFSYLDTNVDGTRDIDEPVGPFSVAAYTEVGNGRLILLSDPSIFINSMINAEDNEQFVRNLISSAGASPQLFIDASHLPPSRLDSAKLNIATMRNFAAQPAPLATFIFVVLLVFLSPIYYRKGASVWTKRN